MKILPATVLRRTAEDEVEASPDDDYQAKKLDGTPIPVTVHVDEVSSGVLDIAITSYDPLQPSSM